MYKNSGPLVLIPAKSSGSKALDLANSRTEMVRQKQAIATFKQAMNMESQFPIDRKISNPIPLYLEETNFAELLYQVGQVQEFDDKFSEAAETYLDIYEFGIKFQQKSGILCRVVGILMEYIGGEPLGDLLDRCDQKTAERIKSRLSKLYAKRSPITEMIEEQWNETLDCVKTCHANPGFQYLQNLILLNSFMSQHERQYKEVVRWAKTPIRQRGAYPNMQCHFGMIIIPKEYNIPIFTLAITDTEKKRTQTQLTIVKAELRTYRLRTGVYPDTLAELPLAPDLTIDPYSNKPFLYRKLSNPIDGSEIELYSVGANGIDDHLKGDDIHPGKKR